MLKIDPHHGTERVQKLKAKLYREQHDSAIPEELEGFGTFEGGSLEYEDGPYTISLKIEDEEYGFTREDDEGLGEFTDGDPGTRDYIKLDPEGSEKFTLQRAGVVRTPYYSDLEIYWTCPAQDTAGIRAYSSKQGMSRQVAEEYARGAQRAAMERLLKGYEGEITQVFVTCTITRAGVEVGSASLAGIESDAGVYFEDVAADLVSEAMSQADYYIDNLLRAGAGLAPREEVEYITGTGKGDGTFVKVYRSGKREEFKSEHYAAT